MEGSTLNFLKKLARNNNRDWFNGNKAHYEVAREDVMIFVEKLILEISKFDDDIGHVDAKKSLFRIHRDTRFSHNKDPYKINFGANIVAEKGHPSAGYYFHIQPGKSFLAGGIYMLENEKLKTLRKAISSDARVFQKIVEEKSFRRNFGALNQEGKLKRVPAGFDKNDPMVEYLKLKYFVAIHPVSDEEILAKRAPAKFAGIYRSLKPLIKFLNDDHRPL